MSNVTYFLQECPTCGRGLEVRVKLLGKTVNCQHCGGQFVAADPSNAEIEPDSSAILRRAEELLELIAAHKKAAET